MWLEEDTDASIALQTNFVDAHVPLCDIGPQDHVISAGGLDLELRLFRLPDELQPGPITETVTVPLQSGRDNPLWIRVTTEDGFQAWTSPTYLLRAIGVKS